jgi:hypothetical protein
MSLWFVEIQVHLSVTPYKALKVGRWCKVLWEYERKVNIFSAVAKITIAKNLFENQQIYFTYICKITAFKKYKKNILLFSTFCMNLLKNWAPMTFLTVSNQQWKCRGIYCTFRAELTSRDHCNASSGSFGSIESYVPNYLGVLGSNRYHFITSSIGISLPRPGSLDPSGQPKNPYLGHWTAWCPHLPSSPWVFRVLWLWNTPSWVIRIPNYLCSVVFMRSRFIILTWGHWDPWGPASACCWWGPHPFLARNSTPAVQRLK